MIFAGLVFSAICFSVLSPWQFNRNAERVQQNAAIQASFTVKPVPVDQALSPRQAPDGRTEWRTVTLTGSFLRQDEMVARLRSVLTEPAYEVLTPMRLTDGGIALVDRGFVRPTDGTRVPSFAAAPTGQVTVTARIRQDEFDPKHRDAMLLDGKRQVYTVDSQTVAMAAGLDIRPGYFELTDGQPGVLSALPLPEIDSGPFFAYAVQWLIFGAFAIFGIGYLIWHELHPESDDIDIAEFDDFTDHEDEAPAEREPVTREAVPAAAASPPGSAESAPPSDTESRAKAGKPSEDTPSESSAPAGATPPLVPADRYGRRR